MRPLPAMNQCHPEIRTAFTTRLLVACQASSETQVRALRVLRALRALRALQALVRSQPLQVLLLDILQLQFGRPPRLSFFRLRPLGGALWQHFPPNQDLRDVTSGSVWNSQELINVIPDGYNGCNSCNVGFAARSEGPPLPARDVSPLVMSRSNAIARQDNDSSRRMTSGTHQEGGSYGCTNSTAFSTTHPTISSQWSARNERKFRRDEASVLSINRSTDTPTK